MLRAVFVLLISASAARAQTTISCTYLHSPRPNSKAAFIEANLVGLSYALDSWNENASFEKEKSTLPPMNLLIAMMRHTKMSSNYYACAEQTLAEYSKSNDKETTVSAATFAAAVYRQHQRLNDEFLEILKSPEQAANSFSDRISTIEVEREKLWNDLTKAITLSALGLMDQKRVGPDGKLNSILLTRAERQTLLQKLVSDFPSVKLKNDDVPTPVKLARLYYTFLSRPLKCADE